MAGSGGVTWGPNTTHSIPFGGSPAPAQGAPAAPAPAFSFGSTRANTPAAPSTFGSTAAPAGGSLFGSSPSTGSLFGPSPAPQPSSLFGQPPAATGTGLFGQTPAPGMGLFGGPPPAPTLFGQPPQQPMQQAQLPAQAAMRAHMDASARQEQSRLANAMQTIHQQYIGTHPATQEKSSNFVKIVYNQATPEYQQMQYMHGMWANNAPQQQQPQQPMRRPVKMPTPAQVSEKDWEEATVRNPDYNHYMPGALVGATALQERLVSQQDRAKSVSEQLQTLQSCLDSIQDRHAKAQLKMKLVQDRQIQQRQKLLALMKKVELYRCRNTSLQGGEIKAMQKAMGLHAQVEHLMNMKESLDVLAQEQIDQANAKVAAAEQHQPPLLKEDIPDEEQLKQVLTEHREELTKLISTVGTDARDLDLIQRRVESLGLGAPRVSLPPSSSRV